MERKTKKKMAPMQQENEGRLYKTSGIAILLRQFYKMGSELRLSNLLEMYIKINVPSWYSIYI